MERAALPRRLTWQIGRVVEVIAETPEARSFRLDLPDWPGHEPGQHLDIRLTAEDGYQATRSYSIASPPEERLVELTVERLEDGEVSPYLVDDVRTGDQLEVRGPIGGYFTWTERDGGPLLLVGGGSGVVPLMSMLRHRAASGSSVHTRLLYSVRSPVQVIYRAELGRLAADPLAEIIFTYTRVAPPGWTGYTRRVDIEMLREVAWGPEMKPLIYVCGPTGFVEMTASALVGSGHAPGRVKTERFGPTGG